MRLSSILRAQIAAGALAILTMAGALFAWDSVAPHVTSAATHAVSTVRQTLPSSLLLSPQQTEPAVGVPLRLVIPGIGVSAPVEQVGLLPDGSMGAPAKWEDVGWYKLGPKPGERGNAVIAGHFDSDAGKAVFYELKKLQPGDLLEVTDDRGATHRFIVRRTETYTTDEAPMDEIFGASDGYRLNLITCGGKWLQDEQRYQSRLAVFSERTS